MGEKKVEDVTRKEEMVAEVDNVSQTATSPESSFEDSKKETSAKSDSSPKKSATKSKELACLISESNVNELPIGKVRELRKRKAANPLNSSASNGKRVEREVSSGSTKKVAFPESDQEERGSQSPSSFGSSKENVPEICNTAPLQKGCPNISKRRRSNKNPVLKTNTVV